MHKFHVDKQFYDFVVHLNYFGSKRKISSLKKKDWRKFLRLILVLIFLIDFYFVIVRYLLRFLIFLIDQVVLLIHQVYLMLLIIHVLYLKIFLLKFQIHFLKK